jgi:hypothetical protein
MSELLSHCLLKVIAIKPKLLIDDDFLIIISALYKDPLPDYKSLHNSLNIFKFYCLWRIGHTEGQYKKKLIVNLELCMAKNCYKR